MFPAELMLPRKINTVFHKLLTIRKKVQQKAGLENQGI